MVARNSKGYAVSQAKYGAPDLPPGLTEAATWLPRAGPSARSSRRRPSIARCQASGSTLTPRSRRSRRTSASRSASRAKSSDRNASSSLPQPARQRRTQAARRYRQHDLAATDDGRQDEVAERRLIDDVDEDAARPRVRSDAAVRRGSSVAATTRACPRRSPRSVLAVDVLDPPPAFSAASSASSAGLTTVTRAPAASSPSALRAATCPPPTTRQARPFISRKTG